MDVEEHGSEATEKEPLERRDSAPGRVTKTVNVLSLVGAIVGVASAFFVWSSYSRGYATASNTLVEDMETLLNYAYDTMFLGELIFCVGIFLSFVTTFGGVAQSLGIGIYLWGYGEWSRSVFGSEMETGIGIGLFIALLSTGIVIWSMVVPAGIGYSGRSFRSMRERILVVCATKPIDGTSTSARTQKAPSVFRMITSDRRWRVLLVLSILLSAGSVAGTTYYTSNVEPAEEIPGGIAWNMGEGVLGYMAKSLFRITVNDSMQSVVWNATHPQDNSSSWAAYDLGYQQLGDLNLTLTYISFGGRITFGFGDAIYLTTNGNSTFREDTAYKIVYNLVYRNPLLEKYSNSYIGANLSIVVGVGFEFHNGEMHSWPIKSYYRPYTSPRW